MLAKTLQPISLVSDVYFSYNDSIFESYGLIQYWSDNDKSNALSNNYAGAEIFN